MSTFMCTSLWIYMTVYVFIAGSERNADEEFHGALNMLWQKKSWILHYKPLVDSGFNTVALILPSLRYCCYILMLDINLLLCVVISFPYIISLHPSQSTQDTEKWCKDKMWGWGNGCQICEKRCPFLSQMSVSLPVTGLSRSANNKHFNPVTSWRFKGPFFIEIPY